jgi:hypothetical protein
MITSIRHLLNKAKPAHNDKVIADVYDVPLKDRIGAPSQQSGCLSLGQII